jgi:hypothetical protein
MKLRITVSLLAPLLLAGCLDVTTEITFLTETTGDIQMSYRVPEDTFYMGVFDRESGFLPIPITERDFKRAERRIDGLELLSYHQATESGTVVVEGRFRFSSIAALNQLYGGRTDAITVAQDGGATSYTQVLFPGVGDTTESTQSFFDSYSGDHALTFVVDPHVPVDDSNRGRVSENGDQAMVTLPISELAGHQEPLLWRIEWQAQ